GLQLGGDGRVFARVLREPALDVFDDLRDAAATDFEQAGQLLVREALDHGQAEDFEVPLAGQARVRLVQGRRGRGSRHVWSFRLQISNCELQSSDSRHARGGGLSWNSVLSSTAVVSRRYATEFFIRASSTVG